MFFSRVFLCGSFTSTDPGWVSRSPRSPTSEPPQRLCGRRIISSSTYSLYKLPLFLAGDMGESVKFVPPLHFFLFQLRPRAALRGKARLWERDPGGIKVQQRGLPPGHGQDQLPMVPLGGDTDGSLIFTSAVFFSFFLGYTSSFSCIKMDALHTQVRCGDVIIRPGWRRLWNSACFIYFIYFIFFLLHHYKRKKIIMCSNYWWQAVKLWRNVL